MQTITATEARSELPHLIDEAARTHQPIAITGVNNSAILLAQEDWDAIQETLNLLAIPGLKESIKEGLATPIDECATELDW